MRKTITMENKEKQNLCNEVMNKIHHKDVKMRPRVYFIVGSFLLALGIFINIFLAVFFFTITVFRLRMHVPFDYLGFGSSGLKPFAANFPWVFLVLGMVAMLSGVLFLKKYDFAYKSNFLLLIIWLVILVIGAGLLLDQIGFNDKAETVKHIKSLYQAQYSGQSWLIGEISQVEEDSVVVTTPCGQQLSVLIDEDTVLPSEREFLVGDRIKVVGQKLDGHFQAKGVSRGCPACERSLQLKISGCTKGQMIPIK